MRKIILFIILILIIGCVGCGHYGLTKFYVNDETSTESYVQQVTFREKGGVVFPMSNVLVLLGADYVGNDLRLNGQYFIFDYEHHMVFLEDEIGRSEYLQLDYPNRYKQWNSTNSLLPSENCLDNDEKYIRWGTKTVIIDDQTLINILRDIGIELQIHVDDKNNVVYLEVSRLVSRGRFS